MRKEWTDAKRIVVKIGSALLVDRASGTAEGRVARRRWPMTSPALAQGGKDVIVVSSGAIALGRHAARAAARARWSSKTARRPRRSGRSRSPCLSGRLPRARADRGADAADARRHRGAPPLSQRAAAPWPRCSSSAPCRSSTRTTRWPRPRSATATTTGWPRASPAMMSADCLVLLSDIDGLYTAPPGTRRRRASARRGARHHAGDRGDGGRRGHRSCRAAAW